jgi:hypothetical protein
MYDDKLMEAEMRRIEYSRIRKYVYRALWSSADVEHFIYFLIDTKGYFWGSFGLRNQFAEKFGIDSYIKYGHPNRQLIRKDRDSRIACTMGFEFGRIDSYTWRIWPMIHVEGKAGSELATSVVSFIRQYIFPIVRNILDLKTFLDFLLSDREPTIWMATSASARSAQIVAVANNLGISRDEILGFLRPFERMIAIDLVGMKVDPAQTFHGHLDRYVDQLLSDLAIRHQARL